MVISGGHRWDSNPSVTVQVWRAKPLHYPAHLNITIQRTLCHRGNRTKPISDLYSYTLSRAVYFHLKSNPPVRGSYSHQYTVINRHLFCVPAEARTRNPLIKSQVLYQLSYRDNQRTFLMVPRVSNPTVQTPLTRAVSLAIYYDAGTIIPQGRRLTPTRFNVFLHQVGMEGLEPSRLAAPDP